MYLYLLIIYKIQQFEHINAYDKNINPINCSSIKIQLIKSNSIILFWIAFVHDIMFSFYTYRFFASQSVAMCQATCSMPATTTIGVTISIWCPSRPPQSCSTCASFRLACGLPSSGLYSHPIPIWILRYFILVTENIRTFENILYTIPHRLPTHPASLRWSASTATPLSSTFPSPSYGSSRSHSSSGCSSFRPPSCPVPYSCSCLHQLCVFRAAPFSLPLAL